ncbi:sodium:calcium antiporter [Clostridium tetani]|uniref:Sodium:calcium antiporter n=1 Tax=Clostridium tetani TaxID=1513 RepID=A0ABY0EPJ5_CLOTA|nr:sodium:calcium antiporter [Clostridium tetani]KHO33668.1 sodium:proton exchanger [Clostridium tetani]RXI39223.1 sodium:calcium antiporter [Clostridium tetani]RXI56379.1 sodium:calcium antiporter [Clostridium tetani]RXI71205.1 sodium:calcium antiporter [Clostridium tetani]
MYYLFNWINSLWISIVMLIVMSWIISKASDKLGDALHILGIKLKIPTSVRGATFDAISSSFPEFSTAMIAVIVYKRFTDVGVPTIAGSGVFNILIIPMATIFAYKGKDLLIKVDKKVVYRDMIFYTMAIGALVFFTYLGSYTVFSGIVLVSIYIGYIFVLYGETKNYRKNMSEENKAYEEIAAELDTEEDMSYLKIFIIMAITIALIWVSIDGIIQSTTVISTFFNIPQYIVSVVIIAACTSIPDTLLSIKSSQDGDVEGAVANAVGSNIFDICICLGVPIIIAGKTLPANFSENVGVLIFLVISMLTTALLLLKKKGVTKKDAFVMFAVYIVFIIYIIGVALNIFS